MNLDAERYARIHAILSESSRLPAADVDAFLDQACGADAELRCQVLELLEAGRAEGAGDFLETSRPEADGPTVSEFDGPTVSEFHGEVAGDWVPSEIGGYTILRQVGRGGMGVVYEAEQASPRRRVAVKLLDPMHATPGTLQRFRQEVELLGRLQHPGIAQIIEAGSFDVGRGLQPFFAMEFVDGMPLGDYVETHGLDLAQRLDLIAQISDVVDHAHQRGIVHRDLKPANILVTTADSSSGERPAGSSSLARPKILDFGVARATNLDLAATTIHTQEGQLVGTVAYMSPEQAAGDPEAIDARSDVYALGVLTYELLSGRTPNALDGKPLLEALRIVREEDPIPLGRVAAHLAGDVETIVGKALEKEKERRYESAAALAEDIRRFLADEPIAARPPTASYHARKFARRNKVLVAGVGATFAALIVGLIGTLTFLFESREQTELALQSTEEARLAAQRAQAINDFLVQDLIRSAAPSQSGKDTLVVDLLGNAAASAGERFADSPELEGEVRSTLAQTYVELGLIHEAEEQCRLALERIPPDGELAAWTRVTLGVALRDQGRLEESLAVSEELAEQARERFGPEHLTTLKALSNVGHSLQMLGRHDEAFPVLERAAEALTRVSGPGTEATLGPMSAMVGSLLARQLDEQARVLSAEMIERAREGLGDEHPTTIGILYNQLTVLLNLARFEEAAVLGPEVLDLCRKVFPPEHYMTGYSALSCGLALVRSGAPTAGTEYLIEAFDHMAEHFGEGYYGCERAAGYLARSYALLADDERVEHWRRRALHIRLMVGHGPELPLVLDQLSALGDQLSALGVDEPVVETLVADAEEKAPRGSPHRMRYFTNLGRALVQLGRHAEAESLLLTAADATEDSGEAFRSADETLIAQALVEVYTALGWDDEAREWAGAAE